jgi:phosphohistidine phosphatase
MHSGPHVLVMRHGPAEPAGHGKDADRRLTAEGRKRTRRAAAALAVIAPIPARIYTSPLVRARETAEILAAATGAASPLVTPLLAPGFARANLVRELVHARIEPLAIVGHEPDLSGFVGWLLGGRHEVRLKFGKGSACLVRFAEPGEAELLALYPLDALTRLAAA